MNFYLSFLDQVQNIFEVSSYDPISYVMLASFPQN